VRRQRLLRLWRSEGGVTGVLTARDLALVEATAQRVVELLDQRAEAPAQALVDSSTLARLLGISRSTVYEHADELGAVEVGGGSRPRLRFDPETALEAWNRRSSSERSQVPQSPVAPGVSRRRRPDRLGSGARLLPVKGRSDSQKRAA
jgi:hypothetical protein